MGVGLKMKYKLEKVDGRPVDSDGHYFVLKLNSNDPAHREASCAALRTYAERIEDTNAYLSDDLIQWLKGLGG